jgi:hypothetical protein
MDGVVVNVQPVHRLAEEPRHLPKAAQDALTPRAGTLATASAIPPMTTLPRFNPVLSRNAETWSRDSESRAFGRCSWA